MDAAEREEFEAQLAQVTPKEIQLEMLYELKAIRVLLEGSATDTAQDGPPTRYACQMCTAVVDADDRREHLTEQHNAPQQMPVDAEFERL